MSKFLDTIDKMNVANKRVVMRDGLSPLQIEVTWDPTTQRSDYRTGTRYRLGVQFGAEVVVPNHHNGIGMARDQVRKLIAHEIYGEFDAVERSLIELQVRLYNVPDNEAQRMAADLGFILIALNKARS